MVDRHKQYCIVATFSKVTAVHGLSVAGSAPSNLA